MKEIDYSLKQNSASMASATMLSNQIKDLLHMVQLICDITLKYTTFKTEDKLLK